MVCLIKIKSNCFLFFENNREIKKSKLIKKRMKFIAYFILLSFYKVNFLIIRANSNDKFKFW